jgi:hypothetical protein
VSRNTDVPHLTLHERLLTRTVAPLRARQTTILVRLAKDEWRECTCHSKLAVRRRCRDCYQRPWLQSEWTRYLDPWWYGYGCMVVAGGVCEKRGMAEIHCNDSHPTLRSASNCVTAKIRNSWSRVYKALVPPLAHARTLHSQPSSSRSPSRAWSSPHYARNECCLYSDPTCISGTKVPYFTPRVCHVAPDKMTF